MAKAVFLLLPSIMLADCASRGDRAQLSKLAKDFFAASATGDSAAIRSMIADTVVLQDLVVISKTDPAALRYLGDGLVLERGGFAGADSAYLYFHAERARSTHGVGVGFVRDAEHWRVSYAGLTGPDITGPTRRR